MIRAVVLLLFTGALPLLSACGMQPLYSGGENATVSNRLSGIQVEPMPGKAGWLVRNAIVDRLAPMGDGSETRYRLDIVLDDDIVGLGVRADDTVTRERRTLRARYQLVELGTGKILLDATAGSDAGIDVTSSEYATIAGENTALENLALEVADQIVGRLAVTLRSTE